MLSEKLQLVSTGSGQVERTGSVGVEGDGGGGGGLGSSNVRWGESVREDGKTLEQSYDELKDEYKV